MNVPKSSFKSKVNITQGVGFLSMLVSLFGLDLDQETQVQVVSGIVGIQSVVTWVMRTWFTTEITKASANRK